MLKEAQEQGSHYDNAMLTWRAPFRHKAQKGPVWVLLASVIVAGILYVSIITENWFFGLAIIVAVIAYVLDHFEETPMIDIKISDIGIKVGKKNIPYANIKGFWMVYHPPFVERLYIRTHQKTLPDIIIELNETNPALVRKFLTRHVVEWEGKDESFMDLCVRLLKL